MKKCSSGILFWINILSSFVLLMLCVFMLLMYIFYYHIVSREYPFVLSLIVIVPLVVVSLSILFKYSKCYYVIKNKDIELSFFEIKKKWYDNLRVWKHIYDYKYQRDYYNFNIDDVLKIGLKSDLKLNRAYYSNDDIVILLENNKKIWIKKGIYSKKQIKEIVSFIKKNKKVIIGENLKKEYDFK